jgi:hypothetical protein
MNVVSRTARKLLAFTHEVVSSGIFFSLQVLVIGAGVTLYEALKAADQLAAQVLKSFPLNSVVLF